jgi:hypothetical protein
MHRQYQPMEEQYSYSSYFPNSHESTTNINMEDSRGLGFGVYPGVGFGLFPPFYGYPGYGYNYGYGYPFYGYPGYYHRPRPYFHHGFHGYPGWHHGGGSHFGKR